MGEWTIVEGNRRVNIEKLEGEVGVFLVGSKQEVDKKAERTY